MKACKKCNIAMDDSDQFCSKCGSKLTTMKKKPSKKKEVKFSQVKKEILKAKEAETIKKQSEKKEVGQRKEENKGAMHKILKKAGVEIVSKTVAHKHESHQKKEPEEHDVKRYVIVDPFKSFTLFQGDFGKIIMGSILALLSIFIIPAIWIFGYLLNTLRNTIEGHRHFPQWKFREQFVDGFRFLGITIAYFIIPMALLWYGILSRDEMVIVGSIILFFIVAFLLPIAMSHYAAGYSSFSFGFIFRAIKKRFWLYSKFFVALILIQLAVNVAVNMVDFSVGIWNLVLWLVALVFSIYLAMVWSRGYGLIYYSLIKR